MKWLPLIALISLALLLSGCPQEPESVDPDDPLDLGEIDREEFGDTPIPGDKIQMPEPDTSDLPEGKTMEELTLDIDSQINSFDFSECMAGAEAAENEPLKSMSRDFCTVMNATVKAIKEGNPEHCAVLEDLENAPLGETDVESNPLVVPLGECYVFTAIYLGDDEICDYFVWPDFMEDMLWDCRAIADRSDFKCLVLESPLQETCQAIVHADRSECNSIEDELFKDWCRARVKRWERIIR